MATYVLPAVQVFQDFSVAPASQANPLNAHIAGPHAQLIRFAQSSEQPLGNLGVYDPLNDNTYEWPNRQAGGVVDQTYTKLFIKNAILRYFEATVGSGSDVVKVAGKRNQIRSASVNFIANGESYPRDGSLLDRDVQLGDIVKARFVPVSGSPVTLWSYVTGFVKDPVAASVGTATVDSSNAATHSASGTAEQVRGPWNAVEVTAVNASAYNPYPTGQVTETYTVIVTGSSADGDFTKASLRVISASGLDDQAAVTPAAGGSPTAIGTLGAHITFDDTGGSAASISAGDQGVSPNDLLAGQKWVVTVHAAFTSTPVPSHSGTYTGVLDTTYIVEVVSGNKFATAAPLIKITTSTGVDISGPTAVPSAGHATPIGTHGVKLAFAGAGLALGDRFYLPVSAAGLGPARTITLGHNIPAAVADNTPADLFLFIKNPALQITADRFGFAPLTNFDQTDTQITIHQGIIAYDPSWTNEGVPEPLPVDSDSVMLYSTLFVEYRAWLSDLCTDVYSINDVGTIDGAISGALDPDNPLKWGVFKALTNSNGSDVMFSGVCTPSDPDKWADVLGILVGREDVYGLVPLTRDPTVLGLYQAHVDDQSSPQNGAWRAAWFSLQGVPTIPIVSAGSTVPNFNDPTTTDGTPALATITQDPDAVGTEYTIVEVPPKGGAAVGNAQFVTNGVQPGDIVRVLYTGDGFGDYTYSEFVVDAVINEDELRLLAGPTASINSPAKIEVWRNLNATQESEQIAQTSGVWADRRIRAVWPDTIETSGTVQEGYHLCAALAGLRSGILPHQGMTNLQVLGFTDVPRTTKKFNRAQLDTLAVAGTWIVTQAPQTGTIYSRHALTTGSYSDINQREEMLTSNVDSISFRFRDTFKPFIGVTNVTPDNINLLKLEATALIDILKTENATRSLGGQLIDATIVSIAQNAINFDEVDCVIDLQVPYALNLFRIHLVV